MPTLQSNLDKINQILDTVNALPDASGGSGVSLNTCTVNFVFTGSTNVIHISATTFSNGTIGNARASNLGDITSYTIENVVCGTEVKLMGGFTYSCKSSVVNIELVDRVGPDNNNGFAYMLYFLDSYKTPDTAGAICTISIIDED